MDKYKSDYEKNYIRPKKKPINMYNHYGVKKNT